MIEQIKHNKMLLLISILIVILVVLLVSKITYAYLDRPESTPGITDGNITASGDKLIFTKGVDLTLELSTDNFNYETEGNITTSTNPQVTLIANSKTKDAKAKYSTGINITQNTFVSSDETPELLLQVKCDNTEIESIDNLDYNENLKGFDITNKTGMFYGAINKEITSTDSSVGVTHTWEYTIVLINKENDQSINETAAFKAEVSIEENDKVTRDILVANAPLIPQTNTLFYHDSNLTGGAGDLSYRYSGADADVNNYVCLDGSTKEGICANEDSDLYRIIGIFLNNSKRYEIKLIKYDYAAIDQLGTNGAYNNTFNNLTDYTTTNYKGNVANLEKIGGYYWTSNDNQISDWNSSILNNTNLNEYFLNTYLKETRNLDVDNLIVKHTYKTIGYSVSGSTPRTYYNYELGFENEEGNIIPPQTKEVTKKIGLMYASDYGFAVSPTTTNNWETKLNSASIKENNWLYMGLTDWTISRDAEFNNSVRPIHYQGNISSYKVYDSSFAVRPVFYISANVLLANGNGTKENPYRLIIK